MVGRMCRRSSAGSTAGYTSTERASGKRRVLVRKENGKRVASPKLSSTYSPRRRKQSSRSALSSEFGGRNGKCAAPSKMPGGGASSATRRTRRSGNNSHCLPFPGNGKVAGSSVQCWPGFLRFEGTTWIENEGSQRRGLRTVTRPSTGVLANTCGG